MNNNEQKRLDRLYAFITFLIGITACLTVSVTWLTYINQGQSELINSNLDQSYRWVLMTKDSLELENQRFQRTLDAKDATIQHFIGIFTPTATPVLPSPTPTIYITPIPSESP